MMSCSLSFLHRVIVGRRYQWDVHIPTCSVSENNVTPVWHTSFAVSLRRNTHPPLRAMQQQQRDTAKSNPILPSRFSTQRWGMSLAEGILGVFREPVSPRCNGRYAQWCSYAISRTYALLGHRYLAKYFFSFYSLSLIVRIIHSNYGL